MSTDENIPSIENLEVESRRVFVRVDFNVPLQDGEVIDATRLEAALPTLHELTGAGARLVAVSDTGGTVLNPDGLPLDDLLALKAAGNSVTALSGAATDPGEAAITADCDILIPAARPDAEAAAANAISDVYAMGGEPKVCLNLLCFPSKILPHEDLEQIIAGALSKITEAGAVLAGGHSVEDEEPKFGLSVIGLVHPDKFWTNAGARQGDALVLTKPLGSCVLFNANLKRWVSDSANGPERLFKLKFSPTTCQGPPLSSFQRRLVNLGRG